MYAVVEPSMIGRSIANQPETVHPIRGRTGSVAGWDRNRCLGTSFVHDGKLGPSWNDHGNQVEQEGHQGCPHPGDHRTWNSHFPQTNNIAQVWMFTTTLLYQVSNISLSLLGRVTSKLQKLHIGSRYTGSIIMCSTIY